MIFRILVCASVLLGTAVMALAQQPKIQIKQSLVTLSAATSNNDFLVARPDRVYLLIQNIGSNPATIAPGDGPVTAGQGFGLDGVTAPATQGGVITWTAGDIPANAFSAISTVGTTLLVWEGRYGN